MSSSPLIPSSPAASEAAAKTNGNFPAPTRAHLILIVVGLTMFFVGHLTKGEVTMISIVKASTTESMYKQKAATIHNKTQSPPYTKEELMSLIREMQANATTATTSAKEEEAKVEETTTSLPKASSESSDNCQAKLDELDQIWNARRENRRQATNDDAAYYNEKAYGMTVRAFDYFEPEAVCMDDERFGGLDEDPIRYQAFGDGPKFLCGVDILAKQAKAWNGDNPRKPCLIYNVGSNNQIEFERAAHMEFGDGCEIHTFDPTLTSAQYMGHNYSQFHDWALGQDGKKWKLHHARGTFKINEMSVHGVMRALRHLGRPIDILKIDCEGCEHAALLDAFKHIAEGKLQIHQIQVEFHLLRFGSKKKSEVAQDYNQFKRIWAAADRANMRVFHKERNGWGCNGYQCVEYAFVSSEYLRRVNSHYVC